ncbi:hypothetical protein [Hymenobacter latericus]|uniref:hypothetical protein n=1 Tax=Hymenobacter sp. YIM 151858-1 TaxID=2987688 RepID=UPI002225C7AD|nr:hypothetical protein [Hymenobacter sp. YIM 151858-1]UYZ61232.1 hypothetical protein OIS50_19880 [Hymenobacter sp. YIM 151858-1]
MPWYPTLPPIPPRALLLLDGLGALLSAIMLGGFWASKRFNPALGLPVPWLYLLSGLALVLALHSLGRWVWRPARYRGALQAVAGFNLLYMAITAGLLIYFFGQVSWLGRLYFAFELLIIAWLIARELRAANQA